MVHDCSIYTVTVCCHGCWLGFGVIGVLFILASSSALATILTFSTISTISKH